MIDKVSIKYDVHCKRSKVKKKKITQRRIFYLRILVDKSEFYILYKLYDLGRVGIQARSSSCITIGQAFSPLYWSHWLPPLLSLSIFNKCIFLQGQEN